MSATRDSMLADPSQPIADLQRQFAECRTERDEALQRETATAEVLGVINSSPGDLGPVFDAVLEKALALCGAAYGGLGTFDGECFHFVAGQGHPEYVARMRQVGPVRPAPGSTIARIVAGEDAVQIADIADDEVYRAGIPDRRMLVDIGGFHTLVTIALRKDNTLLGVLQVYRQEVQPFTNKQIALLQNFAAQAVIAMENARLINETREALDRQTATAEVLQVINSSPGDLAPVFDIILNKAHNLCSASRGALFLFDGETFRAAAAHATRMTSRSDCARGSAARSSGR
jgi:transcriptional regulator with GAF, ATPase, and Fis domain